MAVHLDNAAMHSFVVVLDTSSKVSRTRTPAGRRGAVNPAEVEVGILIFNSSKYLVN